MSTTLKGDRLEDAFFDFLLNQQKRGELLYGIYSPEHCKIFKKKKYPSRDRGAPVQFDVVIEVYASGRSSPHSLVVFECKNHDGGVQEIYVREFSDKLKEIFPNGAKGVLVISSRLQSGAEKVARSRSMGIVKYDQHGLDVIADRKGLTCIERRFVESQIFQKEHRTKSLRFSAYHQGSFFGSLYQFLRSLESQPDNDRSSGNNRLSVPYIRFEDIQRAANDALKEIGYRSGPVNLQQLCSVLSIDLRFVNETIQDADGMTILGTANFALRQIRINAHGHQYRERFTIAHELGHFVLEHQKYLRSESIIENDLVLVSESGNSFNYERLEYQANEFASCLILPERAFRVATDVARERFNIKDRGHGYIYVDDQPCNHVPYHDLLSTLSSYFQISMQAVEIKLKKMELLVDQRKRREESALHAFQNMISP